MDELIYLNSLDNFMITILNNVNNAILNVFHVKIILKIECNAQILYTFNHFVNLLSKETFY